ncbi:hypothetical protein CVT24_003608 [Panaeolus cyanescens]|uniref:PIN domain-containing protein n=1 Tax=Panaeolus cyanescens TaxID=181874 RepID=A0A409Y7V6_9AGAR|nr:hypothetical protein CVT24_003608 [Panaeolus cyanescens]
MFSSLNKGGGQYSQPPSGNGSGHNAYLHATLKEIDQLANEDVEMLAPISERARFLVVDTNILLHHFDVLAQFVNDVERFGLPLVVVVPGAVILELDGQKSRDGLAWFARRASTWLLEKIKERRTVKGQAREETCKSTRNWRIREAGEMGGMDNDQLILDCVEYHARYRGQTILCSSDKNLCINANTQGVHTISPKEYWSSQEMAVQTFGKDIDVSRFGRYKESYKDKLSSSSQHEERGIRYDDDGDIMMVDEVEEEPRAAEIFKSEDPLNMLHEAIVDHFGRLLTELVGRLIEPERRQRPTADPNAYLSEREVPILDNSTRWNAPAHGQVERVQRIIHQTWKSDTLPPKWRGISQACRDMMPDYEYKLWTDAGSREFIAQHYSWFLDTFDNYEYPIQRADVIRYFVLYHYGGIYMDMDIGCLKPMDPLLVYPVILPKTIPVGVSNDLMLAEKGHPFLEQTIRNLQSFDHSWILNYPTVMFSTGPMFLSAQYSLYTTTHSATALQDVRILPKSLYGKNTREGEAPHSFYSHFYGSSWHADDAAFIGFLGRWGKILMWIGLFILIIGLIRLPSKQRRGFRRISGYDILLPRLSRSGRWHFHLPRSPYPSSATSTQLPSPSTESEANSPIEGSMPLLHLPFDVSSSSASTPMDPGFSDPFAGRVHSPLVDVFRRVRNRVSAMTNYGEDSPDTPIRTDSRRRSRNRILFFMPAIFTSPPEIEHDHAPPSRSSTRAVACSSVPRHAHSHYPPEKDYFQEDIETGSNAPSEDDTDTLVDAAESSSSRNSMTRPSTSSRPSINIWDNS